MALQSNSRRGLSKNSISPVSEEFTSSEKESDGGASWKDLCFPTEAKGKLDIFKTRYRQNKCPKAKMQDFEILGLIKLHEPKLFVCKHIAQNALYTMEVMCKNNYRQKLRRKLPIRAKKIQYALQIPFAAPLHFAFKTERNLHLAMEYACFGDLHGIMEDRRRPFTEPDVKFFAAQLILALQFLHAARVVYRSINPRFVSMYEDGYVKLSYFQKAKKLKGKATKTIMRSDMNYRAPEIVLGNPYSFGVDYWALGIFIYETLSMRTPFENTDTSSVCENIVEKEPSLGTNFSVEAQSFMKMLLVKKPSERKTRDVRVHPWFRDLNFEMLWKKAYTFDTTSYKLVDRVESPASEFVYATFADGKSPSGIFSGF
ncbi:protein kinase 2-like [Galendromus occidentalis]|uniref:Protein kinase 2-like n=1 Tax=Galendromus occidentalis TaxID=34638 RepID=A0AAJ6QP62_9ACAR|nr:protein kinase 2-like [Galendromus occidentalis]